MPRKNYSLAHPVVITGLVIVGAVVVALAGLSGGWLKTQVAWPINPPIITILIPSQTPAGQAFDIIAIGGAFQSGDQLVFRRVGMNALLLTTTSLSLDRITARVSAADAQPSGPADVWIYNSAIKSRKSNVVRLYITNPVPIFPSTFAPRPR